MTSQNQLPLSSGVHALAANFLATTRHRSTAGHKLAPRPARAVKDPRSAEAETPRLLEWSALREY